MKKVIVTLVMAAISFTAIAQTKGTKKPQEQTSRDSIKFDTTEVQKLYRNNISVIQKLHSIPIDAQLRDRLDSIFKESMAIIENKFKQKTVKK